MLSPRLPFSVLALFAIGCIGTVGTDSSEELGHASLPLQATTASGVVYRLTKATFVIKDATTKKVVATVKPDPNKKTQDVSLRAGTYTISLSSGWILQRKDGTLWVDTNGILTGQPTGSFKIKSRETITLTYAFGFDSTTPVVSTSPTPGTLARYACDGTVRIAMTVTDPPAPALDCDVYVSKISALAAFTIDCLGTLNATQYTLTSDRHLTRNFQACTTPDPAPEDNAPDSRLASIDGILSLQYPRPDLDGYPEAADAIKSNQAYSDQCIAVAWTRWSQGPQPNVCPTWEKVGVSNSQDNSDQMGTLIGRLPPVTFNDFQQQVVASAPPEIVALEKQSFFYNVTLPAGGPTPTCGTAGECAVACAAGFLGFVTNTDGDFVVADPNYWELADRYPTGTDPFMSAGYYHAMADYGPVPGDQFGHVARARQLNSDGKPQGEACSYYQEGTIYYTQLIVSTNATGSVSWCKAPGAILL